MSESRGMLVCSCSDKTGGAKIIVISNMISSPDGVGISAMVRQGPFLVAVIFDCGDRIS